MSAQFQENDEKKEEKESYSFLKETIKKPPLDKRVVILKILRAAGLGLIFGLMACIGFTAVKPWADEHFGSTKTNVTIPKDEQTEEEDASEKEKEQTESLVLTAENYRQMIADMNGIAGTIEKSMVVMEGAPADADDDQAGEIRKKSSGIIVADNGVEFLILTGDADFQKGKEVKATFYDGNKVTAFLKQQDRYLGVAVYAVEKESLPQNTSLQVKVVGLGNSNLVSAGDPVIAIGAPFGTEGGIGFGTISSIESQKYLCDGQYQLLQTDMASVPEASGVLVDLDGEMIGLIACDEEENTGILSAFAVSELKEEIELLSNGLSIAYLGIHGAEVSDALADSQDMPKGVYVSSTMPDSPAMQAGIQSGDILTAIEETRIYTLKGLREELLDYRQGRQITIQGKRKGSDGYVDVRFEVTLGTAE